MKLDDPKHPEFASWKSYSNFANRVRKHRRYVWDAEVKAFLDTLLATVRGRDRKLDKGSIFYRAQRGVQYDAHDGLLDISAHNADRMKPQGDRVREGRVNPVGIPVLYLATSAQTAISEVRPWIGSELSVAQFELSRDLKAIDLSVGHGKSMHTYLTLAQLVNDESPSPEKKEKAVWIAVDNAFSNPIDLSDNITDYVPTQILAELFYANDYDALIYRSHFGKEGFNIALFDIKDAELINATPYEVTAIEVKYKECGGRYFAIEQDDTTKTNSE